MRAHLLHIDLAKCQQGLTFESLCPVVAALRGGGDADRLAAVPKTAVVEEGEKPTTTTKKKKKRRGHAFVCAVDLTWMN